LKNQKGEIVTGVMILVMAAMMLLGGMALMHGGHDDHKDHAPSKEQNHSEADHQHMSHGDSDKAAGSDVDTEKKQ
jgi:hypothetical protein